MRRIGLLAIGLATATITIYACGFQSDTRLCRAAGYIVAQHTNPEDIDCNVFCVLKDPLYVPWYRSIPDPSSGPDAVFTQSKEYTPTLNMEFYTDNAGTGCMWYKTTLSPHSGLHSVFCVEWKSFSTNTCVPGS